MKSRMCLILCQLLLLPRVGLGELRRLYAGSETVESLTSPRSFLMLCQADAVAETASSNRIASSVLSGVMVRRERSGDELERSDSSGVERMFISVTLSEIGENRGDIMSEEGLLGQGLELRELARV